MNYANDNYSFQGNSSKKWIVIGAIVILCLIGYFASKSSSDPQSIRFYNDLPQKVIITINDGEPFDVKKYSYESMKLVPGTYDVVVKSEDSKVIDEETITLESSFFGGLHNKPLFCYNVGGYGVFLWQNIEYTTYKTSKSRSEYKYLIGKKFITYPSIHFHYRTAPKKITIRTKAEFRASFDKVKFDKLTMAKYLMRKKQEKEAVELYKLMIRFEPGIYQAIDNLYYHQVSKRKKRNL